MLTMVVGAVLMKTFLYLHTGLKAMNILPFFDRNTTNGNDNDDLT